MTKVDAKKVQTIRARGALTKLRALQVDKANVYDPKTKKGTCLSQLILIPRYDLRNIILVDKLPETVRSQTGFGSSNQKGLK